MQHNNGAYEAAVRELGKALTELKGQRGAPSYDRIIARCKSDDDFDDNDALSKPSMSEMFTGRRGPVTMNRLMWLARALLSYRDGKEIAAPKDGDPQLQPWRDRWNTLQALRAAARRRSLPARPVSQELTSDPEADSVSSASNAYYPTWLNKASAETPAQLNTLPLATCALLYSFDRGQPVPLGEPLTHRDGVWAAAFSPDGRILAAGYGDGTVRLWDPVTRQPITDPIASGGMGDDNSVNTLAFSPDGQLLATGDNQGYVRVWNLDAGRLLCEPFQAHHIVSCLAFSPNGYLLATNGDSGACRTVRVWDVATSSMFIELPARDTNSYSAIAFSPQGDVLATGHSDGSVRQWGAANFQLIDKPFGCLGDGICCVAISPDGQLLATVGWGDRTVRLWDPTTHQGKGKSLMGHTGNISTMAFSSDGRRMVTASEDSTVMLWDVATREPVADPLTGHANTVVEAVFSADSSLLATAGGYDGTLRLWALPQPDRAACR